MSNPIETYIAKHPKWQELLITLRNALLENDLEENLKWGIPVYGFGTKNVIGLAAFKNHTGLWFYNGALLEDAAGKLTNAQEGKTEAMRHWRFASIDELDVDMVKKYVQEAIENQKNGREVIIEKKELIVPELLQQEFDKDSELAAAFARFSPSKQRDFAEYIANAKREETKLKRLEKILPLILSGIGLNDKYK
ncbi:MAG: YdeI/OmpD-associated family protein [Calditrichia bacterium]